MRAAATLRLWFMACMSSLLAGVALPASSALATPSMPPAQTWRSERLAAWTNAQTPETMRANLPGVKDDSASRFSSAQARSWDSSLSAIGTNTWKIPAGNGYGPDSLPGVRGSLGQCGLSETEFFSDILSADSTGMRVPSAAGGKDDRRCDPGIRNYSARDGNDVPEPGAICVLGAVLISFWSTQRKRLRDLYRQPACP